jgi:hypothetical protein
VKNVEIILKERAARSSRRNDFAWVHFYDKTEKTEKLFNQIQKRISSKGLVQEAKKQYVISYVTAIEVYFKDSFLSLLEVLGNERTARLVDSKFSIHELKKIIENNISINEVMTSHFNFQDLDKINKVFSELLCINFFETLKNEKYKITRGGDDYYLDKDFYKAVNFLLELRHEIVHDIHLYKKIPFGKIEKHIVTTRRFVLAADYCFETAKAKFRSNGV